MSFDAEKMALMEENARLKAALRKIQRRATKGCQNHPPFSPVYRQAHAIGVIAQQALSATAEAPKPESFGL